MSFARQYRINRGKRAAMGYDHNPPRCGTCRDMVPPIHGVPGVSAYRPPYCNVLGFPVRVVGVCDHWTGADGCTLEQQAPAGEKP